jgi:hypothetical protein
MKLDIEKTAMVRVRAGISYALAEAMDEGHCGLPTGELVPLAEKLLEVPQESIRTALDLELTDGTVIADRVGEIECIFLAGLHGSERAVAEQLLALANGTLPWPWIDADKALPWVERRTGLTLAESPESGGPVGVDREGACHHWGTRGRENNDRQFDSAHPSGPKFCRSMSVPIGTLVKSTMTSARSAGAISN